MKKLAIVLTLISSVAFAQKHMVRMDVDGNGSVNSIDFSMSNKDNGTTKSKSSNIRLNYAYTVAPQWQVGITFGMNKTDSGAATNATGTENILGLSGYYNMSEELNNTCYFGLHYTMTSVKDNFTGTKSTSATLAKDDKANTITLEYGHRFNVGKLWGLHVTYSPSVAYSMETAKFDQAGKKDEKNNSLGWNWLKFDVLF